MPPPSVFPSLSASLALCIFGSLCLARSICISIYLTPDWAIPPGSHLKVFLAGEREGEREAASVKERWTEKERDPVSHRILRKVTTPLLLCVILWWPEILSCLSDSPTLPPPASWECHSDEAGIKVLLSALWNKSAVCF